MKTPARTIGSLVLSLIFVIEWWWLPIAVGQAGWVPIVMATLYQPQRQQGISEPTVSLAFWAGNLADDLFFDSPLANSQTWYCTGASLRTGPKPLCFLLL
ncbi:hypothetical protein [Armatimonas sp.]|uniref:hypothetical protein n=1 Tax=Armatimonas sp. TaxID=1872638 RepID=UPI003750F54D